MEYSFISRYITKRLLGMILKPNKPIALQANNCHLEYQAKIESQVTAANGVIASKSPFVPVQCP